MLTLRNPRFEDRHPYRAWFNEHRRVMGAHALWAVSMICLQLLSGASAIVGL